MSESKNGIRVAGWRPLRKGQSLQGFFAVELPSGLNILDCTYHQRDDGRRWVGMPAKSFKKDDGSLGWVQMIDFVDKRTRNRFTDQALVALDEYLKENK